MSDLLERLDKLADRLLATTQFGPSAHTVLEAKADIEQSIAYMAGIVRSTMWPDEEAGFMFKVYKEIE